MSLLGVNFAMIFKSSLSRTMRSQLLGVFAFASAVLALKTSYLSAEDRLPAVVRNSGDKAVSIPDLTATDWKVLFNGKDLAEWVQKNGWANYRIVDGTVEGTTNDKSPNSFLCTAESYSNFEFTVEVKCDQSLNSGIQIRSASDPNIAGGHVYGPQIEIATQVSGYIYGEGTDRGWLSPSQELHNHFKNEDWNQYVIRANGKRLQTWINGKLIEDITDAIGADSGFIGLQVHSINQGSGPFKVQWRNIRIRPL